MLRSKIEILVDAPLVKRIATLAEDAGITGYTLLPTVSGSGSMGAWSDDQLSGAQAKVMFMAVTSEAKARALAEALTPLLDSHGLLLMMSAVEVVRGEKF